MSVGRYLRGRFKRVLKSPVITGAVAYLFAKYLAFVYKTSRWTYIGFEHQQRYIKEKRPFVIAFWHNRLALMAYSWPNGVPIHIIVSAHGDGRLISKIVAHKGINTIFGSTSRGGASVMREAIKKLAGGHCVAITPDGPRGPRYTAQQGAVHIARIAGVDILAGAYAVTNRIIFKSWDKLVFPLPFSRGVFIFSRPLEYETLKDKQSTAEATQKLQALITEVTNKADEYCDHALMDQGDKKRAH